MIYTPLTKRAMRLCFEAHQGQVDKAGLPYPNHPLHVAEQMTDEASCCVALLHDTVEDTPVTLAQLAEAFPPVVVDAIRMLTHDESVPYLDYVRDIARAAKRDGAGSAADVARRVKMADLRHNSDLTRLDEVTDKDRARAAKYAQALAILGAEG